MTTRFSNLLKPPSGKTAGVSAAPRTEEKVEMKRLSLVGGWVLVFGLVMGLVANPAMGSGQGAPASGQAQSTDKTAPSYDMKAQALLDLQDMQKKFTSLAEAMPADKMTWRPGPGVRSVAEIFMHAAGANYGIPTMMGVKTPEGFDGKTFEKSTTDKAKIVYALNKSFESAIAAVQGMTNADFAKADKKLGPDANDGDVVYILVTHNHDMLGQAIAYARVNGVVPPWTAEALKKQKPGGDAE
jgi:DinB superfamily